MSIKNSNLTTAQNLSHEYGVFLSHQNDVLKVLDGQHGFQLEFHISTKISQALRLWSRQLTTTNLSAYNLWVDLMADIVAQLPRKLVRDGTNGAQVDPYSRLRYVFPGGQTGNLEKSIFLAWEVARSGLGLACDSIYVNLFELLKWTGTEFSEQTMGDIYQRAYGSRTDPNSAIDELVNTQTTNRN